MSNNSRRDFLKYTTAAGISVPLAMNESINFSSTSVKPVVISSANINKTPSGEIWNGGLECVTKAMELIKAGADTLEAVVSGVNIVENDPRDSSVGYGGLPNEECDVELDSCCMHGPSRLAGAVASLRHIKNPSRVAKTILERTDHILIVGEGALRFALKHGFKKEELLTEAARLAWLKWREDLNPTDAWGPSPLKTVPAENRTSQNGMTSDVALNTWIEDKLRNRPTGTINCLGINANGEMSGVTTTSGLAWKIPGRVGDSPLIGCGLYVDNEVGAAGSTGRGEECIYINGSHTVVENMRRGMTPTDAAIDAVKRIAARYGNNKDELSKFNIQFYAMNKRGEHGAASLWKGAKYAVHDGNEAKLLDSVWLFQK